jgi:spore coat polysaccharide biosynthesis protein SpsF (cytidylyltransferase family)
VAIIQARLNSARFPGKMLADLCGKPVLWHVIKQLKKCEEINQIVVATVNDELISLAFDSGAWGYMYKGDENNVLARYISAAHWSGADLVLRITGDCPLIDPGVVDICVRGYKNNRVDLSTNMFRITYPKGMAAEVIHLNTLKRIFHLTDNARYREHVTLFCYENQALFTFHQVFDSEDNSDINFSVDRLSDLDRVRRFLSSIDGDSFTYKDMVRWYRSEELDRWSGFQQGGSPS